MDWFVVFVAYNIFEKQDTKYTVANPNDPTHPFTGAFAMSRTIYEHFGERIIHARDFEKHVKSPKDMSKFFGGVVPMPSPELKQMCGECFVANLEDRYHGNPLNLLEEAMTGDWRGRKAIRAFNDGKGLVELFTHQCLASARLFLLSIKTTISFARFCILESDVV